ncbi:hypothetical protein EV644_11558 [Kribbella orskensis]|uniref:Uncharacterized protein n=1 Tax=Kribbella orskensis TaxID=2512216 RepID=A0ABY2BDH6_9ACTN|nr:MULTISPECIES: hypothetical protein [Kribbella]TCN35496.1 hypothetical protein EV642_11658 [Kribbella sp. VKM Ac-2500]TCO17038.1 hypothetical protein EV644_11558 [Kribbella orskensis]
MDDKKRVDGDCPSDDLAPDPVEQRLVWSIARLIGLLDEAIDSAGAQLARSAGLWDDTVQDKPARSTTRQLRRKPQGFEASTTESSFEHGPVEREFELT